MSQLMSHAGICLNVSSASWPWCHVPGAATGAGWGLTCPVTGEPPASRRANPADKSVLANLPQAALKALVQGQMAAAGPFLVLQCLKSGCRWTLGSFKKILLHGPHRDSGLIHFNGTQASYRVWTLPVIPKQLRLGTLL